MTKWDNYKNFDREEFACQETGECHMRDDFMTMLQQLRDELGEPIRITSGYRDPRHSIEASKPEGRLSAHTRGLAADIACDGQMAHKIIKIAMRLGFTGIGVSQKGASRFVHLDTFEGSPRPNIWSY